MSSATIMRVTDERGDRAVVTHADPEIWLSDELWCEVQDPDRPRLSGNIEIDGDLITFGTPGEGLGQLTYRYVRRDEQGWHIATIEGWSP